MQSYLRSFVLVFIFSVQLLDLVQAKPTQNSYRQFRSSADTLVERDSICISAIQIECRQKTKLHIIKRELSVEKGQQVAKKDFMQLLEQESNKLFNTDLFVVADVVPVPSGRDSVELVISLIEKWYFYPIPILELGARNFNEWASMNYDWAWVDWGIRFRQQNFRGRNEDLRLHFQRGFTDKFMVLYNIPYINRKQTTGLQFKWMYAGNRNLPYQTETNGERLIYYGNQTQLKRYEGVIRLIKRSHFYNTHYFSIGFRDNQITDTIRELNPDYFLEGRTRQRYVFFKYDFHRNITDASAYPLKGRWLQLSFEQKGLGFYNDLNKFEMRAMYARFIPLHQKWYWASSFRGLFSFPDRQPYNDQMSFGYFQNNLRGYESYVIDVPRYALSRNTLRYQLFSGRKRLKFMPLEQFQIIPIALYIKGFADFGYTASGMMQDVVSPMANQFLWSTGVGLDVVTFYNAVFRFEGALNREGDMRFSFGIKSDF